MTLRHQEEDYLARKALCVLSNIREELRRDGASPDRIEYDVGAGAFRVPLSREEFLAVGDIRDEERLFTHVRRMGWPFAAAARAMAESRGRALLLRDEEAWPGPLVRLLGTIRPRFFIVTRVRLGKRGGILSVSGFHPARVVAFKSRFRREGTGRLRFSEPETEESGPDMAFYAVYLPERN